MHSHRTFTVCNTGKEKVLYVEYWKNWDPSPLSINSGFGVYSMNRTGGWVELSVTRINVASWVCSCWTPSQHLLMTSNYFITTASGFRKQCLHYKRVSNHFCSSGGGGGGIKLLVVVTKEYKEQQRLLSGVHSIMRVKLAQAGVGGGCTPTPFHYIYHRQQSCSLRSSWVGRHANPVLSLVKICTLLWWI